MKGQAGVPLGLALALSAVVVAACAAMFGIAEKEHETLHAAQPPVDARPPVLEAGEAGGDLGPTIPPELLLRVPVFPRVGWESSAPIAPGARGRQTEGSLPLVEMVPVSGNHSALRGPLRVEYTLSADLTRAAYEILKQNHVQLGHIVVMDPTSGDLLAFTSTDVRRLPPSVAYPAASLVKVVTAAAALELAPGSAGRPCRYVGSPYRLTPARIHPPRRGREVSLERALATSNNQCFAQLAVHEIGSQTLLDAFGRFGLLEALAPAHEAGVAEDPGYDQYALGRLGCGLAGLRITPLHAALLASVLADGRLVWPRWISRVTDSQGSELALPAPAAPRTVLTPEVAAQLREMLVETTTRGTASKGFRSRGGRLLVRDVGVAAKTGSLSGHDPDGRYEWFIGLAPADRPRLAIAVLVVQERRWRSTPSRIAAELLYRAFCSGSRCSAEALDRFLPGSARELPPPPPEVPEPNLPELLGPGQPNT